MQFGQEPPPCVTVALGRNQQSEFPNTEWFSRHGARVPVPHKSVSEDFPLRNFIRCYKCDRPLTAGWAQGRGGKKYARYWCFTKDCKGVGISREGLESHFVQVLAMVQPTAELLAKLPDIARSNWEQRKERLATQRKQLIERLNEKSLLN